MSHQQVGKNCVACQVEYFPRLKAKRIWHSLGMICAAPSAEKSILINASKMRYRKVSINCMHCWRDASNDNVDYLSLIARAAQTIDQFNQLLMSHRLADMMVKA